jgi:cellulose biosynthesis protein BcsQ
MPVAALYSIKGGVGKTTAAVNLAWLAARDGVSTLLCDLDPQGAATWCFRIRAPRRWSARRLVRGGRRLEAAIRGTDTPRLDLLPAALSYRSLDVLLARGGRGGWRGRASRRLSAVLEPLGARYGLVLLDCPASLTLASVNVLRAASLVLVPVLPAPLAMEAYRSLRELHARKGIVESRLFGFFSMVDGRRRLHRDTCEAASTDPGLLRARIPYVSDVERMTVRREPLVAFRSRSPAARAFEALWAEVRGLLIQESQIGPVAASPV